MYSISSPTPKTMSEVNPAWRTSPLTRQMTASRSNGSSSVSMAGPERAEGVEPLGPGPLAITCLQIPCGDVVGRGVSEDVLRGVLRLDVAGRFADDDRQFRLMVELVADRGVDDVGVGADHRGRRFHEDERLVGEWRYPSRWRGPRSSCPTQRTLVGNTGASRVTEGQGTTTSVGSHATKGEPR